MIGYSIVFLLGFVASKIRGMLCAQVVEFRGKYSVKRWVFGFEHLSRTGDYWFSTADNCEKYCVFPTMGEAQQRLDRYRAENPSLLCKAKRSVYKWLKSSC